MEMNTRQAVEELPSLSKFQDADRIGGVGDSGYNSTFGSEINNQQYGNSSQYEELEDSLRVLTIDEKEEQKLKTKEDENEDLLQKMNNILAALTTTDADGDTYLILMLAQGLISQAKDLIQMCPNSRLLDIKNNREQAAIHIAAYLNLADVIELLIVQNAMTELVDNSGKNILHICAENGHLESLKGIVKSMVESNKMELLISLLKESDNSGYTPFNLGVINKRKEICQFLVNECNLEVDVNAVDTKNGNSPLHESVMADNNADFVYFLLQYCNVDVNHQNNQNVTPLHIAASKGDEAICAILLKFDARCDIKDDNENIPAVYAANNRILEFLKV